jgi:UDP-N-acetylmuramoyl-L-alanyl-D-glutamate--2,6-diaminopimelate ligase
MGANYFGNPEKLKLVGITGTNGKTTIAFIISIIQKRALK